MKDTAHREDSAASAAVTAGKRPQATDSGSPMPAVVTTAVLALGDALVFLIFAAVGRASHDETSGLGALAAVAGTAVPFALGWFLVAPFAGAYRRAHSRAPLVMLRRTLLAWLAAWPVAMGLRWALTARIPLSKFAVFALVVLAANALFLSIWRGLFAFVATRLLSTRVS